MAPAGTGPTMLARACNSGMAAQSTSGNFFTEIIRWWI